MDFVNFTSILGMLQQSSHAHSEEIFAAASLTRNTLKQRATGEFSGTRLLHTL